MVLCLPIRLCWDLCIKVRFLFFLVGRTDFA